MIVDDKEKEGTEESQDDVGYQVLMPPERYIPLTIADVADCLKSQAKASDRPGLLDICALVEGCAVTEFTSIRRRMKKNFRVFAAAAKERDLATRKGRTFKKESDLDEMEMTFLEDFWELMTVAHFKPLTDKDWIACRQERLMLDMPVKIGWENIDANLLSRYFQKKPDNERSLYRHKDYVLVFHRGVGVVRKRDKFFEQKIDLIVKYLIGYPCKQLFYKFGPYLGKVARAKISAMKAADREKEEVPEKMYTTSADGSLEHKHAKHIRRVALRQLMPDYQSVFTNLFNTLEIAEPTYKDIVTLYRKKIPEPTDQEVKENVKMATDYRRNRRNILIHRYDELPIADLEIVLPDKDVGLKLLDRLILLITAIGALLGGIFAFFGAEVELSYILSTLGAVGGKLFQTYSNMQAKKAKLTKDMAEKVHDITMDAQEGALFSVLDEMADQYTKEMMLAYVLLLRNEHPCTQEELDKLCEDYLEEHFEIKIDFAIEESLPRLMRDGLVEETKSETEDDTRLKAVPMDVAHERLMAKWVRAFSPEDTGDLASAVKLGPRPSHQGPLKVLPSFMKPSSPERTESMASNYHGSDDSSKKKHHWFSLKKSKKDKKH